MKRISILALALSILALSCNKETGTMDSGRAGSGEIRIAARVADVTRAATDAGGVTTFEAEDALSLYVWTGSNEAVPEELVVNGEVNTFDGTVWTPANKMRWKNVTDPHFFLGVYPAKTITNFTADPFELDPSAEKYEENDLMVATILGDGISASGTSSAPVPLVFDHLLAKLDVNLSFRSQWGGIPENVNVSVEASVNGTVKYISKTVSVSGTASDQALNWSHNLTGGSASCYTSLVIPQEGVTKVTVTVNGAKYVYTNPADIPLVKGHVTTLPLIVGKDAIVLAEEGISVNGWAEGELPEGLNPDAVVAPKATDLATIKENHIASNGETLSGTLDVEHYPVKISIADGATVTLDGVSILGVNDENCKWAGITCEGDATIILKGDNAVMGFYLDAPGIFIPEGKTLVIKGEGSLTASTYIKDPSDFDTYGYGAGIGGGKDVSCGNIEIQGGNIVANGGMNAAGIGTGGIENENSTNCGTIKISGGSVVATSKYFGAGIGCGYSGICDSITISGGTVEATGGYSGPGIGSTVGDSSCGDIIISGGTVTATTSNSAPGIGSSIEPSVCGNITISGGTVKAIGKGYSPGIGAGGSWFTGGSCGNITITSGVTKVTAIKGVSSNPSDPTTPNSIGAGLNATSCGTVTIGGVVGAITDSPYVYPLPYPINLSEVTSAYVGSVITDGEWKVYKTVADAEAATETPIAIIAYVGAPGSVEESDSNFRGLAIALSDADGDMCNWADGDDWFGYCVSGGVDVELDAALDLINGEACTNMLNAHTTTYYDHNHPAAIFAKKNNDTAHPEDATTWFLPSLGQWNLIVQGLAKKTDNLDESGNNNYKATNLNSVITAAGGTGFKNSDYWSSTENNENNAWYIVLSGGYATTSNKGNPCYVRSAFAF